MGVYLNSKKPYTVYRKTVQSPYFVDKTAILEELIPIVQPDRGEPAAFQAGGRDLR